MNPAQAEATEDIAQMVGAGAEDLASWLEVEMPLAHFDALVAIGLGGNEVGNPAAPYAAHFERAAAIGLPSVPHAGETEGAHSVRSAVEDLGAVRIGHGLRCLEDPSLVELLVERGEHVLDLLPLGRHFFDQVGQRETHRVEEIAGDHDAQRRALLVAHRRLRQALEGPVEIGLAEAAAAAVAVAHRPQCISQSKGIRAPGRATARWP